MGTWLTQLRASCSGARTVKAEVFSRRIALIKQRIGICDQIWQFEQGLAESSKIIWGQPTTLAVSGCQTVALAHPVLTFSQCPLQPITPKAKVIEYLIYSAWERVHLHPLPPTPRASAPSMAGLAGRAACCVQR